MMEAPQKAAMGEAAAYPSWRLGRKSTSAGLTEPHSYNQFTDCSTAPRATPAGLRMGVP